eukprot:2668522-Alexandrium_andersonii.AAC.1
MLDEAARLPAKRGTAFRVYGKSRGDMHRNPPFSATSPALNYKFRKRSSRVVLGIPWIAATRRGIETLALHGVRGRERHSRLSRTCQT